VSSPAELQTSAQQGVTAYRDPAAAVDVAAETVEPSLLDQVLAAESLFESTGQRLAQLNEARTVREALRAVFGRVPEEGLAATQLLNRLVGQLDTVINAQLNAILHNPTFQLLEGTWRGLRYLVDTISPESEGDIRVRVWNCSRKELIRDVSRAVEFDQSQLFHKVYEEEFGTAGGTPYGLLIADYQFSNHPEDIDLMTKLAQVSAASFSPCVTGAGPGLFEMDSFSNLDRISDFDATFERPSYIKWRALRESEDSRFLSLAMPRILMRPPYPDTPLRRDGFIFQEEITATDHSGFLWGNAAYAFGEVAIRTYQDNGWLATVRGMQPGQVTRGAVTAPGVYWFDTDSRGVAPRGCTEIVVTEHQDKQLSEAGIMPLCDLPGTGMAAFYSTQSIQKPRQFDTPIATQNSRISSMFQYMLCVSQFARTIKAMTRDIVGGFRDAAELQQQLSKWLVKYVTTDEAATPAVKAKYPLREGRIQIREHPSKPGSYMSSVHLQPHSELDDLAASVQLTTELGGPNA
jgi:type VI secretion system protein ImpC